MKSLEASEAVALAKEESFEEIIRDLTQRLKDAETRASEGEKQVSDLSKDIETNEKELSAWMDKHAPSIASWRPLTTKCPDIKNKKQSHSHIIASKPSFISYLFFFLFFSLLISKQSISFLIIYSHATKISGR